QKGPRLLAEQGFAAADTQLTYAIGGLALWSADSQGVDALGKVLTGGDFTRLAIANPQIAPYGVAAVQLLERLGLYDQVATRLVLGANIAQTYQFVSTGNAGIGLVARSQVLLKSAESSAKNGSFWMVPDQFYEPIRQDAITLNRALKNSAAIEFMAFINTSQARAMIAAFGYRLSEPG
ncbi:MAG: molybdate ABC transporter substrate-binding protein, partial [Immundisolibacteraceae bacterium]|nr:molybdate ABC transporter substrate-binding protein [Immundisolibacteraceae bacterium]